MMGIPFPSAGERVDRFREVVELVDQLLRKDRTSYRGRYYQAGDAVMRPAPVQRPRPPLTLAGKRPRMLGVIAAHADCWNSSSPLAEFPERSQLLDERCAEIGRDSSQIRRSILYSRLADSNHLDVWESADRFEDVVGRYREVGVSEVIFYWPDPGPDQARLERGIERIAAQALPRLRAASPSPPA